MDKKRIEFSMNYRTSFLVVSLFILVFVLGFSYVYGSSHVAPSVVGHTANEIDGLAWEEEIADNQNCDYINDEAQCIDYDCRWENGCHKRVLVGDIQNTNLGDIIVDGKISVDEIEIDEIVLGGEKRTSWPEVEIIDETFIIPVFEKTKCPKFSADDGQHRRGRASTDSGEIPVQYDGFLTKQGLYVDTSDLGGLEQIFYKRCIEYSDDSIIFTKPYLKDGSDIVRFYPEKLTNDGYFIANSVREAGEVTYDTDYYGIRANDDSAQKFCEEFGLNAIAYISSEGDESTYRESWYAVSGGTKWSSENGYFLNYIKCGSSSSAISSYKMSQIYGSSSESYTNSRIVATTSERAFTIRDGCESFCDLNSGVNDCVENWGEFYYCPGNINRNCVDGWNHYEYDVVCECFVRDVACSVTSPIYDSVYDIPGFFPQI